MYFQFSINYTNKSLSVSNKTQIKIKSRIKFLKIKVILGCGSLSVQNIQV